MKQAKKYFGGEDVPAKPAQTTSKAAAQTANTKNTDSSKKDSALNMFLQVFVGLVTVYVCYLILGVIMRNDKIYFDKAQEAAARTKTPIISGFVDCSSRRVSYNTSVPIASNYRDLRPSNNIKGGSQFTYTFWLNVSSGLTTEVADKVLFIKGNDTRYNFNVTDKAKKITTPYRNELLVYAPMVKFGKSAQVLEVCFNTLTRHNEVVEISQVESQDNSVRNNILTMVQGSWALITISFEDNIPINEFENGIIVKVYVQDQLYRVGRYRSALKQNYGDLIMFPNADPITDVKMADLTYYNYALSANDVEGIMLKGPNLTVSGTYMPTQQPPTLSDYNKLDIYN